MQVARLLPLKQDIPKLIVKLFQSTGQSSDFTCLYMARSSRSSLTTSHWCLFNNPSSKPSARIERWLLELQQYCFTVEYRPGASNPAASDVSVTRQPLLQLRNTPDPDCNISPAQIVFGRPLRDTLSFVNRLEKFSNPNVRSLWRQAWAAKEGALRSRIFRTTESLKEHSRPLRPLALGERVFIQNQQGTSPNKWDRSGIVVESSGHDQYRVKVDGSGCLTSCNRRFLHAYTPATPSIELTPTVPHSSPSTVHASALSMPQRCRHHRHTATPPHCLVAVGPHPSTPPPPCQENLPPPSQAPAPSDVSSDAPTAPSSGTAPTLEPPVTQATVPEPLSILPASPRPCRERRPPKRFEPERGLWVPR